MRPVLGVIGTGKVGRTLARLYHEAGYKVAAINNRTQATAQSLADHTGAQVVRTPQEVVELSNLVLLTVSDDAIGKFAGDLQAVNWHGKGIIHTSGAKSIDVLQTLADQSAMTGSLHPAFPFADVETSMQGLPGATFAIEASHPQLQSWLVDLVAVVDGKTLFIPEGKKSLYHAALVMASNYTVTLYATAQAWLVSLSDDTGAIDNALLALVRATIDNIAQHGIPDALTGPLARADMSTLQSHLEALDSHTHRQAYLTLAKLTLPMLEQRGIPTHTIEDLLQEESHETLDDSQYPEDENRR